MVEVTEQEKALAKSVLNMLLALRILPNTRSLSDYERAKQRWAEMCLGGEYMAGDTFTADYSAGVKYIADYVGV